MSQADSEQMQALNALVATKYHEMMFANFGVVAAFTLILYDYAVTFSREVKCIWGRKFTLATVLFVLNRYLTLLNHILMLSTIIPWGSICPQATADKTCESVLRISEVFTLLLDLVLIAFTSLRMYAIWAKDWRVLVGLAFLGLIPPVVNMYYFTTLIIVSPPPPFVGCMDYVELSNLTADILDHVNNVSAAASNVIVLIMTLAKTWTVKREISRFRFVDVPTFSVLLLRDGTIYFLTLLILFVITLVADIYRIPECFTIQLLIETLSSVLISRFFLNLREVYLSGYGTDGSSVLPSQISTVRFASVFAGNLGAPLQDDFEETAGEEERAYISDDPLIVGLFDESESTAAPILDPRHVESNDTRV